MEHLEDLVDYPEEPVEATLPVSTTEAPTERTASGIHTIGFKGFCLSPRLLKAIAAVGFEHPSEIQKECIPQVILGYDVLGQAKSGMGKTAVFVLGILQQLTVKEEDNDLLAIVIAHTRELAIQINNEFSRFGKYSGVRTKAVYGGINVDTMWQEIVEEKPHVIVATPGRLLQYVTEKSLALDNVKHFVIDEADRVLSEMRMRTTVQEIFMKTPKSKQTMMFSATMPSDMLEICRKYMQNPVIIRVDEEKNLTLHGLLQYYVNVPNNLKMQKLIDLLDDLEFHQVVIFTARNGYAERVAENLRKFSFPSLCIHARMNQEERTRVYEQFKEFKGRILVATDLIGRGIDIERVNVVINYDMPANSDAYLHRVGRAGRFESRGLAISFVGNDDDQKVMDEVQARFEVKVNELTELPNPSTYT
ncbi:hypothetical protein RCL1_003221 [Eukaryota sp. TZLM3-RCL]